MKSNNRWFIVLTVIIIGLVGCNIYLVVQNKNIHTNKEDNDVSEKPISNSSDNEEEKKEKERRSLVRISGVGSRTCHSDPCLPFAVSYTEN